MGHQLDSTCTAAPHQGVRDDPLHHPRAAPGEHDARGLELRAHRDVARAADDVVRQEVHRAVAVQVAFEKANFRKSGFHFSRLEG
jgi:hypothetical protein